jgi:Leucine-rich repeat (LRR) protein
MPQLTRLTLKDGRLTDAALTSVGELTGLTHLDLSTYGGSAAHGRMQISRDGIRQLAALQELEELHLAGHAVPAEALVFDRLTSLSLDGPAVDDDCAARIAACRQLQSLSFSYAGITDEGMKQIATLPGLRRLELDSHEVTDLGLTYLKGLQKLRHLSLRASQITDASLAQLAEIKTLTRLDLHGSGHPGVDLGERFTVAGLQRLKALPKLRTLWLTNLASPAGYLGLAELTQLRVLSLHMCDILPEQAKALQEALPTTTIHAASGGGALIHVN